MQRPDAYSADMAKNPVDELRVELSREMDMMTAVATGGPRIDDLNGEYRSRRRRIQDLLRRLGIHDPNPHVDLWAWYGKWSRDLPTYTDRRTYIRDLFQPLHTQMDRVRVDEVGSGLPGSDNLTRWDTISGQVVQLQIRLAELRSPEDVQAIGLICRDIMISLADELHDRSVHGDVGNSAVKRLYAAVDSMASGSQHEKLRRLLKATIDYANVVQHRRHGTTREAGLVAEATVGVVHLLRRMCQR